MGFRMIGFLRTFFLGAAFFRVADLRLAFRFLMDTSPGSREHLSHFPV